MPNRDTDGFKKYVEAAAVFGRVTRARAEEIVHELVDAGVLQRGQAQEWVDDVVERSRKASEDLVHMIRTEVSHQLTAMGIDRDNLARQVADLVRQSAEAGRRATSGAGATARSTVKKVAAKKPGAKKAAAKKAAATKKARGQEGVRPRRLRPRSPATKKAPAKKAAAKKAPAKKAPGTTAARKASS